MTTQQRRGRGRPRGATARRTAEQEIGRRLLDLLARRPDADLRWHVRMFADALIAGTHTTEDGGNDG